MNGEIALDTSTAIRFLNGHPTITEKILTLPDVNMPIVVIGELVFGAQNSTYAQTRLALNC
jgi:tRNA(fMet)-specific endonuclease VapC